MNCRKLRQEFQGRSCSADFWKMSWSFLGTHRAGCGERGQYDDGWSPNNFCPSLCCGTLLQYPRAAQLKALLFSFLCFQTYPISLLLLYQHLSWCLALWNVFLMRGSLHPWALWPWPCLAFYLPLRAVSDSLMISCDPKRAAAGASSLSEL